MPFYEYQCQRCGHHLEAMQKVSDRPLRKCPKCGKPALTRLMSAPVFRLKGGGWYETDAGAKNGAPKDAAPKEAAGKEAPGKEAPAKEGAAKNEKKPAAAVSSASRKRRRNQSKPASRRR
jgi:putative FmdB family regulatory protein